MWVSERQRLAKYVANIFACFSFCVIVWWSGLRELQKASSRVLEGSGSNSDGVSTSLGVFDGVEIVAWGGG